LGRRGGALGHAPGEKRTLQRVIEVGVPTERLLLGPVGVDHDLHPDPLFAFVVARPLRHPTFLVAPA